MRRPFRGRDPIYPIRQRPRGGQPTTDRQPEGGKTKVGQAVAQRLMPPGTP